MLPPILMSRRPEVVKSIGELKTNSTTPISHSRHITRELTYYYILSFVESNHISTIFNQMKANTSASRYDSGSQVELKAKTHATLMSTEGVIRRVTRGANSRELTQARRHVGVDVNLNLTQWIMAST